MRRALVLAVVAALVPACRDGGSPDASPPSPTGPGTGSGATGPPPPTPAAGWTGTAEFDLSGGVATHADLTMVVDTVSLDPDELVVVWTDEDGQDMLAVLWTGTRRPELRIPLEGFLINVTTPQTREHGPYSDYQGGCSVTLDTFGADGMSGTFACTGLQLPDGQLPDADANGSFSVSRTG